MANTMKRFTACHPFTCLVLAVLLLSLAAFYACGNDEKKWVGLKIVTPPDKTEYVAGEAFDRAGLTVAVVFADGTEAQITAYNVHPSILKEGDETVFVSYKEASVPIAVTVKPAGTESGKVDISLPDVPDVSEAETSAPGGASSDPSEPGPDESESEPDFEQT